jgi:hypothetical protein
MGEGTGVRPALRQRILVNNESLLLLNPLLPPCPARAMSLTAMQTERLWEPPVLVIEPARGFGVFRPKELWDFWDYRELLYFLVWRDVKVRYKRSAPHGRSSSPLSAPSSSRSSSAAWPGSARTAFLIPFSPMRG